MGQHVDRTALAVSVFSWFLVFFASTFLLDRFGMLYLEGPAIRGWYSPAEHRFIERVVDGRSTSAFDFCIVLASILARVIYTLIDRRLPMSKKEKRVAVYILGGSAIWTLAGELLYTPMRISELLVWLMSGGWLEVPLTSPLREYMLRTVLQLVIGVLLLGLCRWDYVRTFRAGPPPIPPA